MEISRPLTLTWRLGVSGAVLELRSGSRLIQIGSPVVEPGWPMNLAEVEQRVSELDVTQGFDLIYDLLLAYGLPMASISRLRSGSYNKSDSPNEALWKGKVFYRYIDNGDDPHAAIDDASSDERIGRERPRFLIVNDAERLVALDTKAAATLDCSLAELPAHADFFLPWAGIERTQLENLNYADVKAAGRMARLYDEITKENAPETPSDIHRLNVFFARLLFCFFAEDTRVFERGQFTNALGSLTTEDGRDVHVFLDELFEVLDTNPGDRGTLPPRFRDFGYVNGNLFSLRSASPKFSSKARGILLECGQLDWSQINPDIFGSMIQAVVHPSQREGLGMHYTSVENIMKVIRPLFLDELEEAFDTAVNSVAKLERLLKHIAAIHLFDPACGSGNFLVIAYKELRRLEHRILVGISELDPRKSLFKISVINLENFFGIEIDDFAHEIATLSLWLAKHQMNSEFLDLFGIEIPLIPLKETGNIVCGNATRMDWDGFCPKSGDWQTYVLGNPPYLGSSLQEPEQKQDFVEFFGGPRYPKNLDYISLWFLKGAKYISDGRADMAFVTTSSVCQGDHVGLMWPLVYESRVRIIFGHTAFLWSNLARGNAGVTCVVVGLSARDGDKKYLYSEGRRSEVNNINAYLSGAKGNTIVVRRLEPPAGLPPMVFGSKPTDGGFLNFTEAEREQMVAEDPRIEKFVRRYMGAQELLGGTMRYCLWIADDEAEEATRIPAVRSRLDRVRASRLAGSTTAQAMADRPYRFLQRAHLATPSIIVPIHSSERRPYIPLGFLDERTVISNAANAIYGAEPWVFGVIHSRMHMIWVRAVAGRLKNDYRYSSALVYNTFPVPTLTSSQKGEISGAVLTILGAREQYADQTLTALYDPEGMPDVLRSAHQGLDELVDACFEGTGLESDSRRLELLFELYESQVAAASGEMQLA